MKDTEFKMIDEQYIDWVNWTRKDEKNNILPLTNTQVKFVKFMLKHKDEFSKVGNFNTVFESVRKYLKS